MWGRIGARRRWLIFTLLPATYTPYTAKISLNTRKTGQSRVGNCGWSPSLELQQPQTRPSIARKPNHAGRNFKYLLAQFCRTHHHTNFSQINRHISRRAFHYLSRAKTDWQWKYGRSAYPGRAFIQ